jgi:hypothetical protein
MGGSESTRAPLHRSKSINQRSRSLSDPYRPGSLGRRKHISPSASLQDLSSLGHTERERKIFNGLAMKLPFPDWNFATTPPIRIPNSKGDDDFYTRAINVFNRIPVVDLHKIGVVYVGPGQTSEANILGNECGSPAYETFLESLGDYVDLKGCRDVYTGGLDTSDDLLDGSRALYWADLERSQIIFHVTTMMPNRDVSDLCAYTQGTGVGKKRHIGNDFVLVVWNESGLDPDGANGGFSFDTISAQFNFINLIITPVASVNGSAYCKMYVQLRKDVGDIEIGGGTHSGIGMLSILF